VSRETERALVTQKFQQAWDPLDGPVAYPNQDFITPKNTMFAVFNLVDRGSTRDSIGRSYLKRHRSTLQIDIYTPASQGTKRAREIATRLENIFDSLDLVTTDGETVRFRTTSARPVAGNEQRASNLDDNWDRYVVECPFDRQEIMVRPA
jgi:hypothetical protein